MYFRLGSIFYNNGDYEASAKYFEKSYDEIGFMQRMLSKSDNLKSIIKINQANALHMSGKKQEADLIYKKVVGKNKGNSDIVTNYPYVGS